MQCDENFIVYRDDKKTNNTSVGEHSELCKKYCGLYNRGNTCYLNSLLQILFMTPELRSNILKWKFNEKIHGRKEDCIPFQLMKLFTRMQLKYRDSEMTEDLTKSFQWEYQELLEQHDIQELCRVLFEALEKSLFEYEFNFINDLFQGSCKSIVKCLKCNKNSEKYDNFMDISLPVKNDKEYNKSLEMSFTNFLKIEKLEADNQYFCGFCAEKTDALKFIKLTKLPKILFLQLNRFEFDGYTGGRRKICHKVTFPFFLDMNIFLNDNEDINNFYSKEKFKDFENRNINLDELLSECRNTTNKDNLYELYAIVVHSGTARTGHYFSYIKSFEDFKWYKFDDSSVYEAGHDNIQQTFGDENFNSTTGYILLYRLIGINNNENINGDHIIDNTNLLLHNRELIEIIEKENIELEEEERKQKDKMNTLKLKVYFNDKLWNITAKKTDTIGDFKSKILKEFNLLHNSNTINQENARVTCLNSQSYKIINIFKDENKTLEEYGNVMSSTKIYSLEVKKENEVFEDYNPDIFVINVCKWQESYCLLSENDFLFEKIKIDKSEKVSQLKIKIYETFEISQASEILLIKKVDYGVNNSQVSFFQNEDMEKSIQEAFTDNSKLYIEDLQLVDNVTSSKFLKFFDQNSSNVLINFNFPIKIEEPSSTPTTLNKNTSKIKKSSVRFGAYKFDNCIEIKRSRQLIDVKNRISEVLGISQDEFIMKKNSHNGVELKNLIETIDKHSVSSLNIYVEYGNPQKDSEIKVNLFRIEYDFSFFLVFPYKIIDEGVIKVDLNWTILNLKKFILSELQKKSVGSDSIKRTLLYDITDEDSKFLSEKDLSEIFIREYKNDKPTKFFNDENKLKDLQFSENKKIIIQRYNTTKINNRDNLEIQLSVRLWDPSQWKISSPYEIHFNKGMTFLELSHILHEYFPDIEPNNMSAYKITNEMNVYMDDFKKYKFENLYDRAEFVLDSYPLFVNTDGYMLIIKDDSKIIREPTGEEIRILCRPKLLLGKKSTTSSVTSNSSSKTNNSKTSINSFNGYKKEKEKGVIISVKNFQMKNHESEGNEEVIEKINSLKTECNESNSSLISDKLLNLKNSTDEKINSVKEYI